MKRKMLSTFALICLAATVQARLGDSFKQSITRFGKPLAHIKDKYAEAALFEYKNYAVFVRYRYNKSFEETYAYLAPGVKDKLHKEEYWEDYFNILNEPKNLEALTGKQRNMLRSANLKATWKFGDIKLNGIEEKSAVLGKRKVTGDYYLSRKVLVIAEKNMPQPKATTQEIESIKNAYMPFGKSFKQCVQKYKLPFEIKAPKWSNFQYGICILKIYFKNEMFEKGQSEKVYPNNMNNMYGGVIKGMTFELTTNNSLNSLSQKAEKARQVLLKYRKHKRLNLDQQTEMLIASEVIDYNELISFPENLIHELFSVYSNTKWVSMPRTKIEEEIYSTWKNGRRLYGTYNIVYKSLTIEYGIAYDDFKPEVIKKLKEKKATEALEGF